MRTGFIKWVVRVRRWLISFGHVVLICIALALAFSLRFDFSIPEKERHLLLPSLWVAVAVKSIIFRWFRLQRGWLQHAELLDLYRILMANLVASMLFASIIIFAKGASYGRSIYLLDFLICFLLTAGMRFAVRIYKELLVTETSSADSTGILIYGASGGGVRLAREIRANRELKLAVAGFLDDDERKIGSVVSGVRVLGTGRDAVRFVQRSKKTSLPITQIVIAMSEASGRQMREAIANCRAAGVACKTIPGVAELLKGKFLTGQIRDLSVNDLLGREPVHLDHQRIEQHLLNNSVLVTGGAGSIGSELCRQIASFRPERLVIFDQAESDVYRIELELRERFPQLQLFAEIGDIRDYVRLSETMEHHRTKVVFHAAAYKHVPLMEANVLEALENNIIGSWNVARCARSHHVNTFVLISSDKAVNPTSIMGTTKRVAELLISSLSGVHSRFVAVRFGNVLGSNGSVVPRFQAQIQQGGPVTVTHPDMRRFFMTTPEAVQLVLQASTMGQGSDIFVLDMGEPVLISDLARNMIRLSGFEPDEDIEIRFTGLRPGEKLYEEIITEGENIQPTYHNKIKIFVGPVPSQRELEKWLDEMKRILGERDDAAAIRHLQKLVPEYQGSHPRLAALTVAAAV